MTIIFLIILNFLLLTAYYFVNYWEFNLKKYILENIDYTYYKFFSFFQKYEENIYNKDLSVDVLFKNLEKNINKIDYNYNNLYSFIKSIESDNKYFQEILSKSPLSWTFFTNIYYILNIVLSIKKIKRIIIFIFFIVLFVIVFLLFV